MSEIIGRGSFRMTKRKFNWFTGGVLGLIALFLILIVAGNAELRSNGYIEIQVPDMRGSHDSYWCKEYREENGCVVFTDALGKTRKICGSYQIIK